MKALYIFLINSVLLGAGLAADAFSVSVVNGINYPELKHSKAVKIAGTYAFFQALMPMAGWFMTNKIIKYFQVIAKLVPRISQFFLLYLGFKMILESFGSSVDNEAIKSLTAGELFVQAIATSVDALLIGFTIAPYDFVKALVCSLIIAGVTFFLCFLGVQWGKQLGLKLAGKATILGGIVLIFIAAEQFFGM